MWIKLLQRNKNIGEMIKPQYINGHWQNPVISGKNKAQLKSYFNQAGVPWIYEKPKPLIHTTSAYNRRPKGQVHENNFETKIAVIRKNLSGQEDRLEKMRQDRYDNMPHKGVDKLIFMTLKGLKFEDGAGKAKGL